MEHIADTVPLDHDLDFHLGYLDGQRTLHLNAYLSTDAIKNVAVRRLSEKSTVLHIAWRRYISGFRRGYQDERAGLAHPLPENDVPYRHDEFIS